MNAPTAQRAGAPAIVLAAFLAALALPLRAQTPDAGSEPESAPTLPAPGEVPAGTSERARALWRGLLEAASAESRGRIQAFDLLFEGRVYSGEKQTNDLDARYLYLEPGFVRTIFKSGRERLRGPRGDFLVERGKAVSLKGKDFEVDRKELEETIAVARTFVGLTDPSQLRLVRLEALEAVPAGLPAGVERSAQALEWVAVESPDFRGPRADAASRLDRVEIGLDPQSHLPRLAIVTDRVTPETSVLVQLKDYLPLDGYRVPGEVTTWRAAAGDAVGRPAARPGQRPPFEAKPAIRLWLKEGRLKPRLEPRDFLPPAS